MAADFVQMDLLAWGTPDPVADIGIPASEPEQEFTDGITPDRFENIELSLPKKIRDTAAVSLARGDSGKWYCGYDVWSVAKQEGEGFAAWPKFSNAYASKYEAFTAAAEAIQGWFATRTLPMNRKDIVRELKLIAQQLDPDQYERDNTCGSEWRECGYAEQCFSQPLDGGAVCLKDQQTHKGKQAAEKSLSDLCKDCHAASFCAGCCSTCKEKCNAAQRCRWPEAE